MTLFGIQHFVNTLEHNLGARLIESQAGASLLIDQAIKIKELYNKWSRVWEASTLLDFETGELEAFIADVRKLNCEISEYIMLNKVSE